MAGKNVKKTSTEVAALAARLLNNSSASENFFAPSTPPSTSMVTMAPKPDC